MTDAIRVMLEVGPKGKKVVAVAPDWPGFSRGAKTGEAAIERLLSYVPRYAKVAELAGMAGEFPAATRADVAEEYPGTGSTDFWGISFAFSSIDRQEVSRDDLDRELALMRGCWAFFDDARARVSAELRKGPRGGGRDRDRVVQHTLVNEADWGKGIGVVAPEGAILTEDGLKTHREAYCSAIRTYHSEGKTARRWPLRFLIRHTAFHTMDHAWEMEDRDLSVATE